MGFMPERSIASMLDSIYKHEFVLPAIQREFVWSSDQVCLFFDSLLRGYPVGTMLTCSTVAVSQNATIWMLRGVG